MPDQTQFSLHYKDDTVKIESSQSVLEALEKAGHKIPNSCRAGLCHSCMMQAEDAPPLRSQQGLSDSQQLQNFFLSCSCYPQSDMQVNLIGDVSQVQGIVAEKSMLNDSVLKLRIKVDFKWFAGQYVSVWFDETQGRSYSIANRYDNDRTIELHIKRHELGLVSAWLHDTLEVGEAVTVSKPLGSCFYSDSHADKPILMAATGTGLAPLYGIVQEALHRQHSAPIYLYAGAGEPNDLYYVESLTELSNQVENFHYIPVVRRHREQLRHPALIESDLVDLIKEEYPDLKGWKIFLCGNPEMIKQVQKHCFFQGAAITDILMDAFIIEKPKTADE